jgi:hypothetical protein
MATRVRDGAAMWGVAIACVLVIALYWTWVPSRGPKAADRPDSPQMRESTRRLISGQQLAGIEMSEGRMRNAGLVMAQTAGMMCELEAMRAANAERARVGGSPRFSEADFRGLPRRYGLERERVLALLVPGSGARPRRSTTSLQRPDNPPLRLPVGDLVARE